MEFVTALRGTFDDGKPSLFELLSEQQLASLLPPTLRYLLTVLTHRYPRYLLRILNSFDELYALAGLLVERHYLKTRGGSFTEHFYGLKREKALAAEIPRAASSAPNVVRDALKLSDADIWKNLAVMVGIPYLKRKLDEAYEVDAPRAMLGGQYTRPPAKGAKMKERFLYYYRWFLRNVYPSLNAAYYFAMLAFNLGYLFDNTKYHNPFLWLIGTRVRRMNGADYQAIEALEKAVAKGGAPRSGGSMLSPRNMGRRLVGSLSLVLPTSIFALKFLEWWYASDFAKQLSRKAAESLDLPPPTVTGLVEAQARNKPNKPKITRTSEDGVEEKADDEAEEGGAESSDTSKEPTPETAPIAASTLLPIFTVPPPKSSDLCPICEDEIQTPAACQTGVVYCFSCIHKWMSGTHARQEKFITKEREGKWESGEGRCAVTGRKVLGGTEGLRRIMV
ncbi:ubiquitin-protein ligase peroxin 12 [Neurospora sp. IMI 360204]|nr:ubiquitin-protein ligase peroxin 12 [Neurospora sp. IMI 360204]